MEISTMLGAVGVSLLLIAYALDNLFKFSNPRIYGFLNFTGATMAALSSYLIDFLPFIILEGTWALLSFGLFLKSFSLIKTN